VILDRRSDTAGSGHEVRRSRRGPRLNALPRCLYIGLQLGCDATAADENTKARSADFLRLLRALLESGRQDLNLRPLGPEFLQEGFLPTHTHMDTLTNHRKSLSIRPGALRTRSPNPHGFAKNLLPGSYHFSDAKLVALPRGSGSGEAPLRRS
jgi:hypothetical protein